MSTVLGVIGFIVLVSIVHWARVAFGNVVDRGVDSLVSQAKATRPTTWIISPRRAGAEELLDQLRAGGSVGAFGGTTFSVAIQNGERVVRCSTPSGADLAAVRTAVLRQARQIDDACELRL